MNKDAIYALEAGIYTWVDDHQNLVKIAQRLSSFTLENGLCDTNTHSPFQIVPTDEFSSDGNLKHQLFLNIDHPAWGYFKINIESESNFEMIPPRLTLLDKTIYFNEEEVLKFITYLSSTLDGLYELQSYVDNKEIDKINKKLNLMLKNYKSETVDHLKHIKKYIETFNGKISIKATNSDVKNTLDINEKYELALMHSENWYVEEFYGIQTISTAQDELRLKILDFFITESQSASFLYVAQKIIKESGLTLFVYEDDLKNEVLFDNKLKYTLVRPVMHATKFEVIE